MTARLTDFGLALLTAAYAPEILADDPGAEIFAPGMIVPKLDAPDPAKEQSRRERLLDHIHSKLEANPSPKRPVRISLFRFDGNGRIVFFLDSLKKRKKRTPSERERRRLLGIQLADFLTAGGL